MSANEKIEGKQIYSYQSNTLLINSYKIIRPDRSTENQSNKLLNKFLYRSEYFMGENNFSLFRFIGQGFFL